MRVRSIITALLLIYLISCLGCGPSIVEQSTLRIAELGLTRHIVRVASDDFEGRFPGSEGEQKTIAYLVHQLDSLGLQPAFNGSFTQKVPLVQMTVNPSAMLHFKTPGGCINMVYGRDFTFWTSLFQKRHQVKNAKVVFAGYGIVAPERGWNDYAGTDVRGKIVLILANDPGCRDSTVFSGKALTHYGRLNVKAAEAQKRGAVGILFIHEAATAGYGWNAERYSKPRPRMQIRTDNLEQGSGFMQGWIRRQAVEKTLSGTALADLISATHHQKGYALSLEISASFQIQQKINSFDSYNVAAIWPGTKASDECVALTAHWDHLGRDTTLIGDQIYNGAADNAVGVAALLEMAAAASQTDLQLDRSLLFLFPTAEERGLLGSAFYTDHPALPMTQTAANLNVDGIFPFGAMRDVGVIGWGMSDLDEILSDLAGEEGRSVTPDQHLEQGYFYRLDMFNFARHGVPTHHIGTGSLPVDSAHTAKVKSTLGSFYHRLFDEYKPEIWDMEGMIQDIRLTYRMACRIANGESFPAWKDGVPFAQARKSQ